jgi:hypothetical protein
MPKNGLLVGFRVLTDIAPPPPKNFRQPRFKVSLYLACLNCETTMSKAVLWEAIQDPTTDLAKTPTMGEYHIQENFDKRDKKMHR